MRLSAALPEAPSATSNSNTYLIGVLPGEGIGPEIIEVALALLPPLERAFAVRFDLQWGGKIGVPAQKESGQSLSGEVISFCRSIFERNGALFCGPGGGRFVYELRRTFDLFCKFTPIQPLPVLEDIGVIRPQARRNVDMIVVRENTAGLYFGDWGLSEDGTAFHRFEYGQSQIQRIVQVAANLAMMRRKRLTVVLKPGGVPAISGLWEQTVAGMNLPASLSCDILEVDNAMYQMLAHAESFDVVVAPNMFGDVLSDGAGLLLGSRGMSFSGNFGPGGIAVYQTGHGAAHILAGTSQANPLGQIYSLAMLLRESFAMYEAAEAIERATINTLAAGWRTPDIAAAGSHVVTTQELGQRIAQTLEAMLSSRAA
jgi:3-isopropylmalate dehydrogenase